MGFWDGSGISWTVCKQSAPRSRPITTPTLHHSILTGRMLFLSNSVKTLKKSTVTNMSSHIFRVLKVAAFMLALFPCMHFKHGYSTFQKA